MNRTIVWTIALGVLALLVGGVYLFNKPSTTNNGAPSANTPSGFPSDEPYVPYGNSPTSPNGSDATRPTMTVATEGGGEISVPDFRKDKDVVADPSNRGHYYLAGSNTAVATYSIVYIESDQSFNITLLEEPIGTARQQAQQELLRRLGISQREACYLRYWVGVPFSINQIYAGKNLGFSFCTEATPL